MKAIAAIIPSLVALGARATEGETPAASPLEPVPYGDITGVIAALCLVLALLFAAAWLVRRFSGLRGPARGGIQLVAQLPLGVREKVLLLRVGEENVLVGCTQSGIRPLHVWQGPCPEMEPSAVVSGPFAEQMQKLLKRGAGA